MRREEPVQVWEIFHIFYWGNVIGNGLGIDGTAMKEVLGKYCLSVWNGFYQYTLWIFSLRTDKYRDAPWNIGEMVPFDTADDPTGFY